MRTSLILPITALGFALTITAADTSSPAHAQGGQIYGSQLMTEQERTEYRSRLRSAASDEERQQIRREHHVRMQERAKERGVTVPDEPPVFEMRQQRRRGSAGQGRPGMPQSGGGRRGG